MMPTARYVDGVSASVAAIEIDIADEGLRLRRAAGEEVWPWSDIARADDRLGEVILRRKDKDSGARLTLDAEGAVAVRAAYPLLFRMRPMRLRLIGSLMTLTAGLAWCFTVGVAMLADPIAETAPPSFRAQLGSIARAQIAYLVDECEATSSLDGKFELMDLAENLATTAGLPPGEYGGLMVVRAGFANAVALPDGSILITDRLIALAEAPEEVAGILAHEIAHVARRHVIKNLVRRMGLSAFVDIVFGGSGFMILASSIDLIGLQFTREQEAEADQLAARYMRDAGYDPGGLSDFFERIANLEHDAAPELLSSHPDSAHRAAALRQYALPGRPPALDGEQWAAVKAACGAPAVEESPADDFEANARVSESGPIGSDRSNLPP